MKDNFSIKPGVIDGKPYNGLPKEFPFL